MSNDDIIIENPDKKYKEDKNAVEKKIAEPLTEEEEMIAALPSNNGVEESIQETSSSNQKPTIVNMVHNADTGMTNTDINKLFDDIEEQQLPEDVLRKINGRAIVKPEELKKALNSDKTMKSQYKDDELDECIEQLSTVVEGYLNGDYSDDTNYFDLLPHTFQTIVRDNVFGYAKKPKSRSVKAPDITNLAAKNLIDEITKIYVFDPGNSDLDSMLGEIKESKTELNEEIDTLKGRAYIENLYDTIDLYEKRLKAIKDGTTENIPEDKEGTIKLIKNFLDATKEVLYLDTFKEFCKTVRIKRYDLERPDKIYSRFNTKYEKHKLNINDISYCPKIINRHLKEDNTKIGDMICIAFCKYCMNRSPNNMPEHTFMYYFVKNIFIMDMIAPKGVIAKPHAPLSNEQNESAATDQMIDFYDTVLNNLKECANNLTNREKIN